MAGGGPGPEEEEEEEWAAAAREAEFPAAFGTTGVGEKRRCRGGNWRNELDKSLLQRAARERAPPIS